MKEDDEISKEHIGTTHRHRQKCGEDKRKRGQGEWGVGARGVGAGAWVEVVKRGEWRPSVIASTIKLIILKKQQVEAASPLKGYM